MMAKEGISKDRKNQQQGYSFRGIDDVYNVLGGMLAETGLCIIPRVLSRSITEKQTKSGSPLFYVVVEAEFDLVSSDDGSKHVARAIGEAMDSADKATNKAMSAAYKYMAFQTFAIPTEGDNDADAHTPAVRPAAPARPTPPPPAVKAQAAAMRANKPRPPIEGTAETITGDPSEGDISGIGAKKLPQDVTNAVNVLLKGGLTNESIAEKYGEPESWDDVTLLKARIDIMAGLFASIGYDVQAMEAEYGKPIDQWTHNDIPEAREVFTLLKAQQSQPIEGEVV
jgi:hypothetical protein